MLNYGMVRARSTCPSTPEEKKNKGRPSPVKEIIAKFITDFLNEQGNYLLYRSKKKYKVGRNGHTLATRSESP